MDQSKKICLFDMLNWRLIGVLSSNLAQFRNSLCSMPAKDRSCFDAYTRYEIESDMPKRTLESRLM